MQETKKIYLSPPDLDGKEKELLLKALESNWITTLGPAVDEFEKEVGNYLGGKHVVALSSGTAAIHLALLNLDIKPGDTVLCSDFTFAASAYPIVYTGATPVFVDSSPSSWNMDPELLEEALRTLTAHGIRPRVAVVVDLYGQSADFTPILDVCSRYGVAVIEDAAEALGATYQDEPCGTFGVMGIFSFNGNKIITTSAGGMLISDKPAYVQRARYLATQARDPFSYYQHSSIGYNYRLSNLLAAVGSGQFATLAGKLARRRQINEFYRAALADLPGISFMPEMSYGKANCWLTCVVIDPRKSGATSQEICTFLANQDIESRRVWKPMHLQPVFAGCKYFGGVTSEYLFENGLCLPSGSALTTSDLDRIVDSIRSCIR